jgi:hypothetical protein
MNLQLGKFSSRKNCTTVESFEKFIGKKLDMFTDDLQSSRDFMGKEKITNAQGFSINNT